MALREQGLDDEFTRQAAEESSGSSFEEHLNGAKEKHAQLSATTKSDGEKSVRGANHRTRGKILNTDRLRHKWQIQ